jgi:hypothetical protein
MGLYYKIWVDFIKRAKKSPGNHGNWQVGCMIFMTLAMASNFILIMTILERHVLKKTIYTLDFSFLPSRANSVLSYLILFILPCWVINYLFIFRNKRYLRLLERYPYYNGKLAISYLLISLWLPIVLLLIGFIFF